MKVRIERHGGGPVRFEDFADANGLEMVVRERADAPEHARYYAHFDHVEVMDRGCLVGQYGNGATPENAIASYAFSLKGKRIAFRAMSLERREIECPTEWLP